MAKEEDTELEHFIVDWYYGERSHRFAQNLGRYLFEFIDDLNEMKLTNKTIRKHIDNCWAIGYLECSYGYKKRFFPSEVFYSPIADYTYEYKRKFSDSKYAISSYKTTWKKLFKYTKELGLLEDE